jgi:lipopolysaccharide transport system permease protein
MLVSHRRLLVALAKRELSDEYVGHSLSMSWAVIHPLFLMVVYVFVFIAIFPSRINAPAELETDSIVYLMSGLVPWLAISQVMSRSLTSVTGNGSIVKQMAFPLELLPVKTLAGPLLFSGISLVFLIGYSLWITKGAVLPAYLYGLPLLIVLTIILLTGLALVLSCLQVFLRDMKEFINLFLTIGLFIHPILYFPRRATVDSTGATAARIAAASVLHSASERQLMEQLDYNLLFRWFVGSPRTIRCGMRTCSARTGTVCSTATSRPSFSPAC